MGIRGGDGRVNAVGVMSCFWERPWGRQERDLCVRDGELCEEGETVRKMMKDGVGSGEERVRNATGREGGDEVQKVKVK